MGHLAVELAVFVLLPVSIWLVAHKQIPLTILPIIVGVLISALSAKFNFSKEIFSSSLLSENLGLAGVLLMVFSAGMEIRKIRDPSSTIIDQRVLISAATSLVFPLIAGSAFAYFFLANLNEWRLEPSNPVLSSASIGICLAVSALPVLVGLVRELKFARSLGHMALRIAAVHDFILWIGLALLLKMSGFSSATWSVWQVIAGGVLLALAALSNLRVEFSSRALAWITAAAYLAVGAFSTHVLGVHAVIGAYIAGVTLPKSIIDHIPIQRIGFAAMVSLAPLYFGRKGLDIDGSIFGGSTFFYATGLLLLSGTAKMAAVIAVPPAATLSKTESAAIGCLLQCKGLMEIVAAAILREHGLLTAFGYAVLVVLALLSTLMTMPLFRMVLSSPKKALLT